MPLNHLGRVIRQYISHHPLRWRHNDSDGVSNHQPHDCLHNRLFRRRSKKTSKLRVTGLCEGNTLVTSEFPAHKGPVTRKMFPFDDVIMISWHDDLPSVWPQTIIWSNACLLLIRTSVTNFGEVTVQSVQSNFHATNLFSKRSLQN